MPQRPGRSIRRDHRPVVGENHRDVGDHLRVLAERRSCPAQGASAEVQHMAALAGVESLAELHDNPQDPGADASLRHSRLGMPAECDRNIV